MTPRTLLKKVIILDHDGGELANQLWNYASIYAYTIERGYKLTNPSFFEYGGFFSIPAPNLFTKIFFFIPFNGYTKRKNALRRKMWRKLYSWCKKIIIRLKKAQIITCTNPKNTPYYLPPTGPSTGKLNELEQKRGSIFFDGWLFRNPMGLDKYREKIVKYFRPEKSITRKIKMLTQNIREQYSFVIGVHIRQGDYQTWKNGTYFIEQMRVRQILDEHLSVNNLNLQKTHFLITSDGPINEDIFSGLNITVSKENATTDLFLLASTDTIIGSNSTFGAFAAYYANIPFIVMQKGSMDWEYYHNKTKFFENKYSTMVHY